MKNCDEMVNSLLERRNQYITNQKRKKTLITRAITSVCCVCLVTLMSLVLRQKISTAENSIIIDENGYAHRNGLNTGADAQSSEKAYADLNNDPSVNSNISVGNYPDNYVPCGNEKTMISSFDSSGMLSALYVTPENGEFSFSTPLHDAMNEYKDSVLYRIIVDVFSDKHPLSPDSSQVLNECERLSNSGYIVAYETAFNGESYRYYFTLHATYEQLILFNANADYGYFMFLYDERIEQQEKMPTENNVLYSYNKTTCET